MVVTRDHIAGPCPCSGDINARAARARLRHRRATRLGWLVASQESLQESHAHLVPLQKSCCTEARDMVAAIVGDSLNAISRPEQSSCCFFRLATSHQHLLPSYATNQPAPP